MKPTSYLIAAVVLLLSESSGAACIAESLDHQLAEAEIVFVAIVTKSSLAESPSTIRSGTRVRVKHEYDVRRSIKGNPGALGALYSLVGFDDPLDGKFLHFAEQVTISPGDSVLVVAQIGEDAGISLCSATRKWDSETAAAVSSHLVPKS